MTLVDKEIHTLMVVCSNDKDLDGIDNLCKEQGVKEVIHIRSREEAVERINKTKLKDIDLLIVFEDIFKRRESTVVTEFEGEEVSMELMMCALSVPTILVSTLTKSVRYDDDNTIGSFSLMYKNLEDGIMDIVNSVNGK